VCPFSVEGVVLRIQPTTIAAVFGSFRCYDTSEITLAGVLRLL
jgi:hypothetical protein